ncbi:MAG TPA: pilin [Candidatus Paceibacterota bacterium]
MKEKIKYSILPLVAMTLPFLAEAADLGSIISKLQTWVGLLVPIVFALCLLVFLWGLVIFIAKSGDETERKEGKQKMLWGIIALFVAVSIWGITNFIGTTLDIDKGVTPGAPGIPGSGGTSLMGPPNPYNIQ